MSGVSNLYVADPFVIPLGSKYANLQQKITSDTSCGESLTLYCSNFTSMEILRLSPAYLEPKRIKKGPQQTRLKLHPCPTHNSVKQGSHSSTLLIRCVNLSASLYTFPPYFNS